MKNILKFSLLYYDVKLIHFILLSIILISLCNVEYGFSQTREESISDSEKFVKTPESLKIHSLLTEWKSSLNPELFAKTNNLSMSNNKISVYIYLDTAESISKLPQDLEITRSSSNIVVAYVDGRELTQLSQLDFVQRIEPPVSGSITGDVNLEKTVPDDNSGKIAEVIQQWQDSPEPATFASEHNLLYSDGKIRTYLYLVDKESISKLPVGIDVQSSSDNIVVAILDSSEINQLSQLDFVQRIEPPVSGTTQTRDNDSIDEIFLYLIIAIIIVVITLATVMISKRKKIAKKL